MGEWACKNLEEVVALKRGFDLPHSRRTPGPYPILSSGESIGTHSEGPVRGPGFAIGRATNLGRPVWSDGDFWPLNTTLFVTDFKGNIPRWTYHLFEALDLTGYDSGSVQPMLNRNYIAKVPVLVPAVAEQKAIAEVLGALDDKIAANRKLAETAEELADALFAGAVFDSAEYVAVGDAVKNISGKYLAKDSYSDTGRYFVYGSNSVMGKHSAFNVEGPLTVLARIGSYCGNLRWSQKSAWVNNNASALVAVNGYDHWIVRHALRRIDMNAHRAGSGQPFIRVDALLGDSLVIPSREIRERIAPELRSLADIEASAAAENESLAATRDALLPALMSGRVRVKDVMDKG